MIELAVLRIAQRVVAAAMPPTPQYCWPGLSRLAGCQVWLKHENHTPIGAFKVRGGLMLMEDLHEQHLIPERIFTATRGNHGQSIPFAARRMGVPVTVFAPKSNSREKNDAMRGWGAELVEFGDDFEDARRESVRRAEEANADMGIDEADVGNGKGVMLVPPFCISLVTGVATYALELFEAVSGLDAVYVPIGMGSGICGLIETRDTLHLETEIIGVVAANAPAMALSVAAGKPVATQSAHTFADGMACRLPMAEPVDIIRKGAARIVEVGDDEIADAMRAIYRHTHNVAESAGAAAFAALMQEQERHRQAGNRVGVILSGGNVDAAVFSAVLAGETPTL